MLWRLNGYLRKNGIDHNFRGAVSLEKLAICIPTYNRGEKIRNMLDHTAEFAEQVGITIHISDNCSTDNTKEIIREFTEKYSNVYYYKQKKNIGWLANFDFIVHETKAEYRWLCGDDDLINLDQITHILKLLSKNVQLLIVNGGRKISENKFQCNAFDGDAYVEYVDKDELFGDLAYYTSWMSGLIFSDKMIEQIYFRNYTWTAFPHMVSIFDYLSKQKKIQVGYFPCPCIYANDFESGGQDYSDKAMGYFTKEWYRISRFLNTYSEESQRRFLIGHRDYVHNYSLKEFMTLRIMGHFNYAKFREYEEYLQYCTTLSLNVIKLVAIAPPIMPKLLYMALKKIKHFVKKRK